MKKVGLILLLMIIAFMVYAPSLAEGNYVLTASGSTPANDKQLLTFKEIIPSKGLASATKEALLNKYPSVFSSTKVGKSEALVQENIFLPPYAMDVYYVFDQETGYLSKITYLLSSEHDYGYVIDFSDCKNYFVKQMGFVLGEPTSVTKGITEWAEESYTVQIGIAKMKNYTGNDDSTVVILFKLNFNLDNQPIEKVVSDEEIEIINNYKNLGYDELQQIFLLLTFDSKIEDVDSYIAYHDLTFQTHKSKDNRINVILYKIGYSTGVTHLLHPSDGDYLAIQFNRDDNTFMYAYYRKYRCRNTAILMNYGPYFDLRSRIPNSSVSGYYYNIPGYDYVKCGSAEESLQNVLESEY